MPNILPTTPEQNLKDLKSSIDWFSDKWNRFTNTKVGKTINRFFNGPTEEEYNKMGMNKPSTELGVASLVVPKFPIKYRFYTSDGSDWNTTWMLEDLDKGKDLAKEFLTNKTRNDTFVRNNAEFKKLTGKNLPRNDSFIDAKANVKFSGDLNNSVAGRYSPKEDLIMINARVPANYDRTLFHELLHRNRFGEGRTFAAFNNYDPETQILAQRFYDSKTFPLINLQNSEKARYFMNPGELPVNMLEVGAFNGLKFGETYPGAEEAIKKISEIEKNDPWAKDVLPYINYKQHPELAWKALTGTLLGTTPLVVVNTPKETKNESSVE